MQAVGGETGTDGHLCRERVDLSPHLAAALRRFVARRVANDDDAADIAQQAVLLACVEFATRHPANLSRWLFTVAQHLIVDHYRAQKRFRFTTLGTTLVEAEPALQTRPDLALAIADCREQLVILLDRIARLAWLEHQVAILMSDVYGYGDKQSAAQLRMSLPCFKLMLHGARSRLREIASNVECAGCPLEPVCLLPRLGVTCGLSPLELFAMRGKLLQGLKM